MSKKLNGKNLAEVLQDASKNYIRDVNLLIEIQKTANSREGLIKRALKKKELIKLKRGVYFIGKPYNKNLPNLCEIGQLLYSPSYISLETALSFYGWIPEAVYTTTSVSPKRSAEFKTPFGLFSFSHTPLANFYSNVHRIETNNGIFLIAEEWKAIADYIYVYKKKWKNIKDIILDLRIEEEKLRNTDPNNLENIIKNYDSKRVKRILENILKELNLK